MRLSAPVQHLFMIERGWDAATLDAMAEDEFGFWFDEAIALEEAKAEAVRETAGTR
ncbi:hypothetical protein [Rhizobium sp. SL86]|uniref:hypothetical protein n=1 Tax=Rhizobium sp. SL86 TaxID=2995148 RepID=UPI002274665F|nr:hypothetical protein [Rhizobium sp. SL86]MCY1668067.1 hypothetical protein [Rhizobium sp. SL86]